MRRHRGFRKPDKITQAYEVDAEESEEQQLTRPHPGTWRYRVVREVCWAGVLCSYTSTLSIVLSFSPYLGEDGSYPSIVFTTSLRLSQSYGFAKSFLGRKDVLKTDSIRYR